MLHVDVIAQHINSSLNDKTDFPTPETLVIEGNVFVKAIVSKTSCFIDEPILVTYKFYNALNSQSRVSEVPTFTGCSVQEMTTDDMLPTIEEYNGKRFRVTIIRRVQLYPLHAGDIVLGSAAVENTFTVYTKGNSLKDIRNGTATLGKKVVTTTSSPVTIHVTDFPEKNKPANFDGAIGDFTIKATVAKQNDTANENNSLQIIIEGAGTFQNINKPIIQWPVGIDFFEATGTEATNKLTFPTTGAKVFTFPFVVKQKGKYVIPAISFSFYNINTQQYQTITTENILLNVADALPNKVDATKISGNITNYKYIWFVPAIALVVALSLLFSFRKKKPSVQELIANADTMIEHEVAQQEALEISREKTPEEKLNQLLLCESDHAFYSKTIVFITYLLQKEANTENIGRLQLLHNQCNEVLYANNQTINKDLFFKSLEDLVKSLS